MTGDNCDDNELLYGIYRLQERDDVEFDVAALTVHEVKCKHFFSVPAVKTFEECNAEDYDAVYEKALQDAKDNGAEAVVFGDIDIEGHREWDTKRAENVGLKAEFPLWHINRRENVENCLNEGFKAVITCVDTEKLSKDYLGKILDWKMLKKFEDAGIDVCGENGEYHTMVVDAPMFQFPLQYKLGKMRQLK